MEERYKNNIGSWFTEYNQQKISNISAAVIGCGGNGGYLIDYLARLGVRELVLFDHDNFEESNLNRQLFCNENSLGQNKAIIAGKYVNKVNSDITVKVYPTFFANDFESIAQCDIIFCELDYGIGALQARNTLRQFIVDCKKPVVDGTNTRVGYRGGLYTYKNVDEFDLITNSILNTSYDKLTPPSQPAAQCALGATVDFFIGIKYLCHDCQETTKYHFDMINNQVIRN